MDPSLGKRKLKSEGKRKVVKLKRTRSFDDDFLSKRRVESAEMSFTVDEVDVESGRNLSFKKQNGNYFQVKSSTPKHSINTHSLIQTTQANLSQLEISDIVLSSPETNSSDPFPQREISKLQISDEFPDSNDLKDVSYNVKFETNNSSDDIDDIKKFYLNEAKNNP